MDMNTPGVTETKGKRGRKPKGRVEGGQEQVQRPQVIRDRLDELVRLGTAAKEASADYGSAIKKAAEDSGMLAKAVRSFVAAKIADKGDERRRECEQLSLLFEEVKQ